MSANKPKDANPRIGVLYPQLKLEAQAIINIPK
jgi:hypothetical protein